MNQLTENIRNFVITAHIDLHTKRESLVNFACNAYSRYGVGVDHGK